MAQDSLLSVTKLLSTALKKCPLTMEGIIYLILINLPRHRHLSYSICFFYATMGTWESEGSQITLAELLSNSECCRNL